MKLQIYFRLPIHLVNPLPVNPVNVVKPGLEFCPTFVLAAFTFTAEFDAQTLAESRPSSSSPHVPPKLVDGVCPHW